MAASRRENLAHLTAASAQHVGLWLDRFLPALPERDKQLERSPQAEHIFEATRLREPLIYRPAFARWEHELLDAGAIVRAGVVEGRVAVGLGAESVLETAVTLHRVYGVPFIPGTALKGMAAAYARRFLDGDWALSGDAYKTVFGAGGHTGQAGYVTFFDALYIPGSSTTGRPLEPDVLTVHHPSYYQSGAKAPADWDSPNPVAFVSATGAYLLALGGPSEAWIERTFELLAAALKEIGVGAKTASGYGRMTVRRYTGPGALLANTQSQATKSHPQSEQPLQQREAGRTGAVQPLNIGEVHERAAPAGPSIPAIGEVFTGLVLERDNEMVLIEVPGFTRKKVVALLKVEPETPRWKAGRDKARCEVISQREHDGIIILRVRWSKAAPRQQEAP